MTAILFLKPGEIAIRQTFLAIYLLWNLMKLAAIFQDLEHLYDFQTIG